MTARLRREQPALHLFERNPERGVLCQPVRGGPEIRLRLTAAPVHFLCVLKEAWDGDTHKIPEDRGWRKATEIAVLIAARKGERYPMAKEAVHKTLYRLNCKIAQAIKERGDGVTVARLIQSERGVGMRLGPCGLFIHFPNPVS